MPGASPVKHNVDAFLDHSDDYKLDDVEANLHKIHKEFIQFKESSSGSHFFLGQFLLASQLVTVTATSPFSFFFFFFSPTARRTTANSWSVATLPWKSVTWCRRPQPPWPTWPPPGR